MTGNRDVTQEYRVLDMRAKRHAIVSSEQMLEILNRELSDNATIGYCTHIGFNLPHVEDLFKGIGSLGKRLNLKTSLVDSIPGLQEPYLPTRTYTERGKRRLAGAQISNVPLSEIPYNQKACVNCISTTTKGVFWFNVFTSYQRLLSPTEVGLLVPLLLEAELLTFRERNPELAERTYREWLDDSRLPETVQIIGDGYSMSFGYYLANLEWLVLRRQIKQPNIFLQQPVFIPDKEKKLHPYREHLGQEVLILQLIRDENHLNYILHEEYKPEILEKYTSLLPPKFVIAPKNPRIYLFQGLRGDSHEKHMVK